MDLRSVLLPADRAPSFAPVWTRLIKVEGGELVGGLTIDLIKDPTLRPKIPLHGLGAEPLSYLQWIRLLRTQVELLLLAYMTPYKYRQLQSASDFLMS